MKARPGSRWLHATSLLPGLLIFGLAIVLYVPAIRSGFIWDDDSFLTANALVSAPDGLRRFWFSTDAPDYFPLTSTTLWLEWRLWAMNATGYHVTNVLLHALSSVLLWRIFRRLNVPGAWLAAAVFAVHPVCVESVAWITQRKNVLPMLLACLSTVFYLRANGYGEAKPPRVDRRTLLSGSLLFFVLALLSKTSVVTLPAAFLLIGWWRRGSVSRSDLVRTLPFFVASGILSLVTIWFQYNRSIGPEIVRTDGLASRLAVAGRAVWFYLYKAVWPTRLLFVYPRWPTDPPTAISYVPLLLLLAVFVLGWRYRRTGGRAFLVVLGGYVVLLLPVLGFLNIYFMRYSLVADHWQYPALPFLAAGVTGAACAGFRRRLPSVPRAGTVAAAAVLLILFAASWSQQQMYADEKVLWEHTLEGNPECWIAHNNLGGIYTVEGRLDKALYHLSETLRLKPDHAKAHNNIGNIMMARGDVREAVRYYRKTLDYSTRWSGAYFNLALALARLDETGEAEQIFRKGLELEPDNIGGRYNFGVLLLNADRPHDALAEFRRVLSADPDHVPSHRTAARALSALGRHTEAARHERRARELTNRKTRPEP